MGKKTIHLPTISVVIATKNEEINIGRCLESIRAQNYPSRKIEIIVVDNNSPDRTKEIAKKYTKLIYNYPTAKQKKNVSNFRGAQVNYGVKKSRGEIVFFPDADMTFQNDLFKDIAGKIKKYDALYIPEIIIGKGYFGKIRNFERSFYNQTVIDAVRVVKKRCYLKVGGYDETRIVFGADDWDLTKSIKQYTKKISYTSQKLYHHENILDWKAYINKKKMYADCFKGYVEKWGSDDFDIKKQFGLKYRAILIFTEKGKWRKFVSKPHLAFGMYLLRFVTWINFKYHYHG